MIAEPWLPDAALHDDAIVNALRARAQEWSTRWFVEPKVASVRAMGGITGARLPKGHECWRSNENADLLIAIEAPGLIKVASAMLGIPLGWPKLTPADAEVIDALSSRALEDLFASFMELAQQPATTRRVNEPRIEWALRYSVSIANGAFTLDLYAPRRSVIAIRKGAAPRGHAVALETREASIQRQEIDLGVMLGTGSVSLSELHSLARGDVLVLDRGRADPVHLAINDQAQPHPRCSLGSDGGRLKLQLQTLQPAEAL